MLLNRRWSLVPNSSGIITAIMDPRLPLMNLLHSSLNSIMTSRFRNIRILIDLKASAQLLRPNESQENDISVNAAHKDTHDFPVLVTRCFFPLEEAGNEIQA